MKFDAKTAKILPWVIAISFFMQMLDTTIMNTALPSIAKDLEESPLNMQSVIISYMLTVAFFMPISGWLADRFGIRNVFVMANLVFILGSALSAGATSLLSLVLARVIQGIGGAFMMPVGRLTVMRLYPRSELVRVLSFISIPALVGPMLGPTVGGLLTQYASWHWIFLINIPVGFFAVVAIWRFIPNVKMDGLASFDFPGFALIGLAVLSGTVGMEVFANMHLPLMWVSPLLLFALLMLLFYVFYAKGAESPIFDLKVLKIRSYTVGILGNIFARFSSGVMPFMTPLLLQVGLGYTPFAAGLMMMPTALMSIFGKGLVNKLLKIVSFRTFLSINTVVIGVNMGLFALIGHDTPVWSVILHLSIFGIFNSMQFTAMFSMTLIDLPQKYAASGNSILSTIKQLSMGVSVGVGAAILAFFSPESLSQESIPAFHKTYIVIGTMSILAAAIFLATPKDTGKVEPD